jgi:hypothetical protein
LAADEGYVVLFVRVPVWMETHCNWFIGRDGGRLNANGGPIRKKKEIDWKGGGARVGRKRGHRGYPSGALAQL